MSALLMTISEVTQKRLYADAMRSAMMNDINNRKKLDIDPTTYGDFSQRVVDDELEAVGILNYLLGKRKVQVMDASDLVMDADSDQRSTEVTRELLKFFGEHIVEPDLYLFAGKRRHLPRHYQVTEDINPDAVAYVSLITPNGAKLRYGAPEAGHGSKGHISMLTPSDRINPNRAIYPHHDYASDELAKQIVRWLLCTGHYDLVNQLISEKVLSESTIEWISIYRQLKLFANTFKPVTNTNVSINTVRHSKHRMHNRYFIECDNDALSWNHYDKRTADEQTARHITAAQFLDDLGEVLKATFTDVKIDNLLDNEQAVIDVVSKSGYYEFSAFSFLIDGFSYTARVVIGRTISIMPTDCVGRDDCDDCGELEF